jgi:hypothetical protein
MAQFSTVLSAFTEGQSVRRTEWEPFFRMLVLRDYLMCQCRNITPWHHSLTWTEIAASDWHPVDAEFGVEQGHEASILPALISSSPERSFLKLSAKSQPLRAVFWRWWNAD